MDYETHKIKYMSHKKCIAYLDYVIENTSKLIEENREFIKQQRKIMGVHNKIEDVDSLPVCLKYALFNFRYN